MRPPPLRIAAALLASVAGIATGHAVIYTSAPLHHSGTAALEAAGHHHWPLPWEALPVALLVACSLYVVGTGGNRRRAGSLASPLAAIQAAGFLGLEATERLVAIGSTAALPLEPVILIGLVVQIVVAVAIAGLLTVSAEVVHPTPRSGRVARTAAPEDVRPRVLRLVPVGVRPGRQGMSFRGPPLLA